MKALHPSKRKTSLNKGLIASMALFVSHTTIAQPFYQVEGNSVDKATLNGWNIYRKEACGSCHGANGEGNVSNPNLNDSFKALTKERFRQVLLEGRGIMYSFAGNKTVVDGIDDLYAYLKGRSDGAIPPGDLTELK